MGERFEKLLKSAEIIMPSNTGGDFRRNMDDFSQAFNRGVTSPNFMESMGRFGANMGQWANGLAQNIFGGLGGEPPRPPEPPRPGNHRPRDQREPRDQRQTREPEENLGPITPSETDLLRERRKARKANATGRGEQEGSKAATPSEDEGYKDLGNKEFAKGNYQRAIDLYAIALSIKQHPIYFSNTAICHYKLGRLPEALNSIARALDFDQRNPKFFRVKGVVMAAQAFKTEDIDVMAEALDEFARAKKLSEDALNSQNFFNMKRAIALLREEQEGVRLAKFFESTEKYFPDPSTQAKFFDDFLKHKHDIKPGNVPRFLTCPITLDLMKEPVQVASGISYERAALEEYWRSPNCQEGLQDPITKQPIAQDSFYAQNKALKANVEEFLRKKPWAYDAETENATDWRTFKFLI